MELLNISRPKSLKSQITDYLRDAIQRGSIADGIMLSPTTQLAKEWGTSVSNVHAAMSQLAKEGFLIRKNGVGTLVNRRQEKLDTILVYEKQGLNVSYPLDFRRLLLHHIKEELDSRQIKCKVVYSNQQEYQLEEINDLLDKRLIQGIILPSPTREERKLFDKLPIPFSCMTSARIKNRVAINSLSFAEKAVEGLLQQKCKRVGLLLSMPDYVMPHESGEKECHNFIEILRRKITESGMTLTEQRIFTAEKHGSEHIGNFAQYAFDGFNAIWNSPEKPDGLIVHTDDLISGTLIAILAAQVRVPEDLKLVLHHNAGQYLLCPVPCCLVETSPKDMAYGLVQLLVDQYYGKEIKAYELDSKLVNFQNTTCN